MFYTYGFRGARRCFRPYFSSEFAPAWRLLVTISGHIILATQFGNTWPALLRSLGAFPGLAKRQCLDVRKPKILETVGQNLQTMVHVEIGEARLSGPDGCLILGVTGQGAPTPRTREINRPIHARGSGIGSAASRPN
ncbi:hypothetical protein VNO77_19182 [Canavalia gladiata]|uniref:Uncharacterized protein n=1 Tax=Canavalia gladiata TaxID=3824 RepID=A0AAN9QKA2_CANGL